MCVVNFSERNIYLCRFYPCFSEYEATVDFNGNILEGELPLSKMKLVAAWIELHQEELIANWELLNRGEKHFRIRPLQ